MRARTISNRPTHRPITARSACYDAAPILAREFTVEEIDPDGLAEAIRRLLNDEPALQSGADPDLLLPRPRGSHVVGLKTPK
jgi:hypothetical protein